jgi:hypothetical protein
MRTHTLGIGALLVAVGALGACSSSTAPSRIMPARLNFNAATMPKPAPPPSGRRASFAVTATTSPSTGVVSYTDGTNTLVLDSLQLVLAKIELERPQAQNCEVATPDSTLCDEIQLGPVVVNLPLKTGVIPEFTVPSDTGTFTHLQAEIHRLADADAAILAAHPELKGASIRVVGQYNGKSFVYTTDLDVEQTMDLTTPTHPTGVVVSATIPFNLTLMVDVSTWFQNAGLLVDPGTALAGQPNEGLVKANIRASFKSFEDENLDGVAD